MWDKIKDSCFVDYLSSFDLICLTETWIVQPNELINLVNYTTYTCDAKLSVRGGRNMGGVVVYIKNTVSKWTKHILKKFDFGLIFSIDKAYFDLNKDVILVCLYLPPESSPMYKNQNTFGIQIVENLVLENPTIFCDHEILIVGDLNSRTGSLPDFVLLFTYFLLICLHGSLQAERIC